MWNTIFQIYIVFDFLIRICSNKDDFYIISEHRNSFNGKLKKFKSSRQEVFCKKSVLRNYAKFTGKHLWQSLFFNKASGLKVCVPFLLSSICRYCIYVEEGTLGPTRCFNLVFFSFTNNSQFEEDRDNFKRHFGDILYKKLNIT